MKEGLGIFWDLLKKAFYSWNRNDSYAQSATIAYYALFSFPTLLVIVVNLAGKIFGEAAIQGKITEKLGEHIGTEVAKYVEEILINVSLETDSVLTIIFGIVVLFIASTGMFFQLKMALNNIWNVAEKNPTFFVVFRNRLISFGMIMVLGLLLLIFFIISVLLTSFTDLVQEWIPGLNGELVFISDFIISFTAISTLIASVFKILPDVVLKWKLAFVGASLTTFLFLLGEFVLSLYFKGSSPGMIYGAASSIVIILIWVYYTCLIIFFGAEFTVQYALFKNEKVTPTSNAEPAIYQELEKLKNKRIQLEEEKHIIDRLQSGFSRKEDNK